MKKILLLVVISGLVGCSSIRVKPVALNTMKQASELCIENNPKVTVPEFNTYLTEAFLTHKINTRFYDKGAVSPDCQYKLNYIAYRSWDIAMYLSQVKLEMFEQDKLIAEVNWKQGSGALNKWRSTKGKVDDLVGELLGEVKTNKNTVK